MDYLISAKAAIFSGCVILAAGTMCLSALADETPIQSSAGTAPGPQLRAQTQATDNGPSPITLRLQYTGEAAENAMGGLHDGATYMNQILAQLRVDSARVLGWTGGTFVLEAFYANAYSLDTQYVGAA